MRLPTFFGIVVFILACVCVISCGQVRWPLGWVPYSSLSGQKHTKKKRVHADKIEYFISRTRLIMSERFAQVYASLCVFVCVYV